MKCWASILGMVLGIAGASLAQAQSWPAKPVRMILAFPPGGPTDIVSRVLAQKLGEQLGQQVLVDNKAGAGGNIGAEMPRWAKAIKDSGAKAEQRNIRESPLRLAAAFARTSNTIEPA